ncbi:MAG: phosphoribosylglycinamide synthetase [Pseudomonadota bacterium]
MRVTTDTSSARHPRCLEIPQSVKDSLRVLFLAKHALSDGTPDAEDGTHATYHRELLDTLEEIGLRVTPANSFDALTGALDVDFIVSLLNRAGFRNSEMLAPLLAESKDLPYLGGSPIVRGLTDDKHLLKHVVANLGLTTPEWKHYALGGLAITPPAFDWNSLIIKPNASSASWGIHVTSSWAIAERHITQLHQEGHDVIVERYIDGTDLAAPVIAARGGPWYFPVIRYDGDSGPIRTYEQKRDLVPSSTKHVLLTEGALSDEVLAMSQRIVEEVWPFDHGRLEYRVDSATGEVHFIEMNINCNLWSRKTIASVGRQIGVSHRELIETILCASLERQGLIPASAVQAA